MPPPQVKNLTIQNYPIILKINKRTRQPIKLKGNPVYIEFKDNKFYCRNTEFVSGAGMTKT